MVEESSRAADVAFTGPTVVEMFTATGGTGESVALAGGTSEGTTEPAVVEITTGAAEGPWVEPGGGEGASLLELREVLVTRLAVVVEISVPWGETVDGRTTRRTRRRTRLIFELLQGETGSLEAQLCQQRPRTVTRGETTTGTRLLFIDRFSHYFQNPVDRRRPSLPVHLESSANFIRRREG